MTDEKRKVEIKESADNKPSEPLIPDIFEVSTSMPDPQGQFNAVPPVEIATKVLQVQGRLGALFPSGVMNIRGNEVKYITKHQVINALVPLMMDSGLVCIYGGIHHIDTLDKRTTLVGSPRREVTFLKERLWAVYHLVDVDTGAKYSQMIPADVSGMDAKNATVALAFGERDFLSQVFMIRAKGDAASVEDLQMEDYSPLSVARNLDMEGIRETLEIKATNAIHRVSRRKVDEEAQRRGITVQARTEEMNSTELMEVIDICMELMNPSSAKDHLASIGREKHNDPRSA
ncbi:MAG: hypothetical protein K8S62_06430 [Candidatus Sabulitectum sp.]|nr:hypothetical protein [Candidatus Sabulitectum sp.]